MLTCLSSSPSSIPHSSAKPFSTLWASLRYVLFSPAERLVCSQWLPVDTQTHLTFGNFLRVFTDSLFFPLTQETFMECLLVLSTTLGYDREETKTKSLSSCSLYSSSTSGGGDRQAIESLFGRRNHCLPS